MKGFLFQQIISLMELIQIIYVGMNIKGLENCLKNDPDDNLMVQKAPRKYWFQKREE